MLRGPFRIPGWPRARPTPYRCSIPAAPTCDILLRHHPHLETNVVAVLSFWSPGLSDLLSAAVAEMFCFVLFFWQAQSFLQGHALRRYQHCLAFSCLELCLPFPVLFPSMGRAMPQTRTDPQHLCCQPQGSLGALSALSVLGAGEHLWGQLDPELPLRWDVASTASNNDRARLGAFPDSGFGVCARTAHPILWSAHDFCTVPFSPAGLSLKPVL